RPPGPRMQFIFACERSRVTNSEKSDAGQTGPSKGLKGKSEERKAEERRYSGILSVLCGLCVRKRNRELRLTQPPVQQLIQSETRYHFIRSNVFWRTSISAGLPIFSRV